MNIPSTYILKKTENLDEVAAKAYVLVHRKSGAHLILMETADDNKVFTIGFKTPVSDDTGVPHILEHSVLCGSEKYPVKDPFVELSKGSLNTFLNAFTARDKTLYPVASTNDQDFRNLMSVYMDAVFHPNIYNEEKIFRQEGWHYEMQDAGSPLTLNGVVYNEMRGAFSDPDSILERYVIHELFPDTPYGYESGGDPAVIPSLTYENYLKFHARYYHPSNSYIYLYGNMDFEERLQMLDEEYLGGYDAIDPASEIPYQEAFEEEKYLEIPYGISEGEDEDDCIFQYTKVVGGLMDPVRYLAYEVLSYALVNAPGAELRQALLDAECGVEIYGTYDTSLLQPVFSVTAKGAGREKFGEFITITNDVLHEIRRRGIPKKTLLAGINNIEFSLREADYGRYPKGLVYAMQIMDTWMQEEDKAFIHMKFDATFRTLKENVETCYFEDLLDEMLESRHAVKALVYPEVGLVTAGEEALAAALAKKKAAMTDAEILKIVEDTKLLKAYQDEASTPEQLETIPLLQIADIRKQAEPFSNEMREIGGIPAVYHDYHTSGILYADLRFSMECVPDEDLPYAALLKNLYTMLDTKTHSYQELNDEICLYTGGLGADISNYTRGKKDGENRIEFIFSGRAVESNIGDLVRLLQETCQDTLFEDTRRIHEMISEVRSEMQTNLVAAGHSTAVKRVLSYVSENACIDDRLIGLGFYRFLEDLDRNFEERKDALKERLKRLSGMILTRDHLVISVTAEETGYEKFAGEMKTFLAALPEETGYGKAKRSLVPVKKNEGFRTSSQVQYAALGGNFGKAGFEFSGAMRVLKTVLGYDYLWLNCRVKGGAYGCMSYFSRYGEACFVTYRDPNLAESLEIFRGIPAYLRELKISPRDMRKYIIGTISDMDVPLPPSGKGKRSMAAFLTGFSEEELQRERDQVLACSVDELRGLADLVQAVVDDDAFCVVGSESKILENSALFMEVKQLAGEEDE